MRKAGKLADKFIVQHSCELHTFCQKDYRLMDTTANEEAQPLPLPVERQFNNAYIKADFKNRNIGTKASLLING